MFYLGASDLSRDFYRFIKSIGEVRSKQEEERLARKEIAKLKAHFLNKGVSKLQIKEYLVRAIYVDMLGFNANFAHIHAINMAQEKNLLCKTTGYIACTLLLKPDSELMLLLINTMQKDLNSPNHLERGCALTCICSLLTDEMLPVILPSVIQCLDDTHEIVRKKSIMAIFKIYKFKPSAIDNIAPIIQKGICDPNPSVMGATLGLLDEVLVTEECRVKYAKLVPSLVSIIEQICDHRLSSDYDYHNVPAPWIQISIIRLFGKLCSDDMKLSNLIYECLHKVIQSMEHIQTTGTSLISHAIIFEAVRTVATIYPNEGLATLVSLCISRQITSTNNNLKYIGISGLSLIVSVNMSYAVDNQMIVVSCLEDRDDTIRKKTLDLLYRMTNSKNVAVIINCFITQLKTSTDKHEKVNLIKKIITLSEKYAPDATLYVDTIIELMVVASSLINDEVLYNLINVLKEQSSQLSLKQHTLEKLEELYKNEQLPDVIVKLIVWSISEFVKDDNIDYYYNILLSLLKRTNINNNTTVSWLLDGIRTVVIANGYNNVEGLDELLMDLESSDYSNVIQRCKELCLLIKYKPKLSSIEEDYDFELTFLSGFVRDSIDSGCKPYNRPKVVVKEVEIPTIEIPQLKYEPYVMESSMCEYNEYPKSTLDSTQRIICDNIPRAWGPSGYLVESEGEVQEEEAYDEQCEDSQSIAESSPLSSHNVPEVGSEDELDREREEMARALFSGLTQYKN